MLISRGKRKGISSIISTVILTSVMLIIAITVMAFANNIFSIQSDSTEFDQAKNIVVNFAGIVDDVASKQGSSGYVRFNTRSGGPYFAAPAGKIKVTVIGPNNQNTLINDKFTNLFKYKGGSYASAPGKVILSGSNKTILVNNEAPLGLVYMEQKGGGWVVMNFTRIGIINLGTFNFSRGLNPDGTSKGYKLVNMLQVSYINITYGASSGSGSVNSVAQCRNITTSYTWINYSYINNPAANYDITFNVQLKALPSELMTDNVFKTISVKGNDVSYGNKKLGIDTMIVFVNSEVRVYTIG